MRWLVLFAPLSVMAGDLQLDWAGDPPFQIAAVRIDDKCQPVPVFDFKTQNKREIVQVDFRRCTAFSLCNESGCQYLPRRTFANGLPVICKPLSCR